MEPTLTELIYVSQGGLEAIATWTDGKKQQVRLFEENPGKNFMTFRDPRYLLAEDGKYYWAVPAIDATAWHDLI